MSYLQDKKTKKKKYWNVFVGVIIFLFLFYFRSGIFKGLSHTANFVARPVLVAGGHLGGTFKNLGSYFASKSALQKENEDLRSQIEQSQADRANYSAIVDQNTQLQETLNRKTDKNPMLLATILAKPNISPYDTLTIDVGQDKNLNVGSLVFALGDVPIGRISDVYPNSSKVILFSNPGQKTSVQISGGNVFAELTGRGGSNFEIILPRDLTLANGDTVLLPGITPYVVGVVQTTITDPRDAFTKALLTSPVNIFEQQFVEVEI